MKNYQHTLKATGGLDILAVIEGLPVNANGFFLTEAQMDANEFALGQVAALQETIKNLEDAATTHNENMQALNSQLTAANDQLVIANSVAETATAQLATASTDLATANQTITTLTAENERLGKLDGSRFNGTNNQQDTDPETGDDIKAEEMAFQKELNDKV